MICPFSTQSRGEDRRHRPRHPEIHKDEPYRKPIGPRSGIVLHALFRNFASEKSDTKSRINIATRSRAEPFLPSLHFPRGSAYFVIHVTTDKGRIGEHVKRIAYSLTFMKSFHLIPFLSTYASSASRAGVPSCNFMAMRVRDAKKNELLGSVRALLKDGRLKGARITDVPMQWGP